MKDVNPKKGKGPNNTCGAKTRNGTPCRKPPLLGATRCRLHGGASPRSLEAARKRLLAAVDPALQELVDIAMSKESTEAGKIRAIENILDNEQQGGAHGE